MSRLGGYLRKHSAFNCFLDSISFRWGGGGGGVMIGALVLNFFSSGFLVFFGTPNFNAMEKKLNGKEPKLWSKIPIGF